MKKKTLRYFATGLLTLFLFFLFTVFVKNNHLEKFDFNTTVRLQNHIPKKFDLPLSLLSLFGSFEIMFVILSAMIFFRKKIQSWGVLILFITAHVVETLGKALLTHPGPPIKFFRYDIPFLFPSSYVQPGSSYPSGHSLRIVAISLILAYIISLSEKVRPVKKWLIYVGIFVITVFMLISRVSLGEHWTTDVVGGSLLGLSTAFFSLILL